MSSDDEEKASVEKLEGQRLLAEKARLEQELLNQYREWVEKDYKDFLGTICKLTLGIPDDDDRVFSDTDFGSLRKHYSGMAETILHCLNGEKVSSSPSEYISLINWVKNNAQHPRRLFPQDIESPDIERISRRLFLEEEYNFGISLHWLYELVYHGTPIYTNPSESGAYQMVPINSHDYIFMFSLGRQYIDIRTGMFPEWIKDYYFKQSDLEAHSIFFRGDLPDETGINALRHAYRHYLSPALVNDGAETDGKNPIQSAAHDRLLKAIAQFPLKYAQYKSSPPKLDSDVRPWMQNEGLATSEAEKRVFGAILAEHFKLSPDSKLNA